MNISNLPEHEQPLSEQFRIVAKRWVDCDAAANLLEETKSAVLAQMMAKLGDMPVSRAEMNVKASDEWTEHITLRADLYNVLGWCDINLNKRNYINRVDTYRPEAATVGLSAIVAY